MTAGVKEVRLKNVSDRDYIGDDLKIPQGGSGLVDVGYAKRLLKDFPKWWKVVGSADCLVEVKNDNPLPESFNGGGMRVLFVCHNNLFWRTRGGEKSSLKITRYLMDFGYNCKLAMPEKEDVSYPDKLDIKTINVASLPDHWMTARRALSEDVGKFKPEVILTWSTASRVVREISKANGIPYVMFVRSYRFFNKAKYPWYNECLRDADSVITNCKYTKQRLEKEYSVSSVVSYVPVRFCNESCETSREYLTIIGAEKATEFIKAIMPSVPDRKFLIVDYGIEKEHTSGRVLSVPYQSGLDSIWAKTNILLFPASEDMSGTSHSTMEAMSKGIPVIAQNRAGLAELNPICVAKDASAEDWRRTIDKVDKNWLSYSKRVKKYAFENHDPLREMDVVRQEIERVTKSKGKVLFYLKEGLGNIVEMLPTVKAVRSLGYKVSAVAAPTTPDTLEIIREQTFVDDVFEEEPKDYSGYKYLLACHWKRGLDNARNVVRSKTSRDKPEYVWYFDLAKHVGYDGKMPEGHLSYPRKWFDLPPNTIAFSPGSVTKSWALKRWDCYDRLSEYFSSVVLLGHKKDALPEYKWPGHVVDHVGKLLLPDAVSMLAQCVMFIGHDCGLGHIAASMGLPTFIIFGPTSDVKNLPRGAIKITKQPEEACQPCQYSPWFLRCEHRKCLVELEPGQVIKQIGKHMGKEEWKRILK